MSKILLTHSYFLRRDNKQWKERHAYPPLATLYAASVLLDASHDVTFFDVMFERSPAALKAIIERDKPQIVAIYDDSFNYLTKMCLTKMQEAAMEMIQIAKASGCTVVVSGHDMSDHAAKYLQHGADYVIVGEAEATLRELVDLLEAGMPVSGVAGLAYLADGELKRTARREVLRNLDSLPLPAWNLIDFKKYGQVWRQKRGLASINLATTRGCPFKCNWCAKPVYGNRYNSHSPAYIVREIKMLKSLFDFDHIWFADDIFGLKPGWVEEFARLLNEERIAIRYKIQSRADLMSAEVIDALKRSGCEEVWMGVESGSQKILDAMEKGITLEQVKNARAMLKRADIRACFFLQFGYRGEELADIRATEQMLVDLQPDDIGISVSYPLPGTKFYDLVQLELGPKTNWSDSNDLAMLYRATYPEVYYRLLHRKVHWQFRLQQMSASHAMAPQALLRAVYFRARLKLTVPKLRAIEAQ